MDSRKRKREDDPPLVTFTAPGRNFDRLLKETSLDDLKATVLKKLGLAWNSSIAFSQLRGSKRIDLEDDDDFEAFRSYAFLNGNVEVIVSHAQSRQASPRLDTSFHTEEFRENKRSKISHPTVNIDSPVTIANSVPPPENTQRAVAFSEDKILYSNTVQRYSERKARPKQKEGKTGESAERVRRQPRTSKMEICQGSTLQPNPSSHTNDATNIVSLPSPSRNGDTSLRHNTSPCKMSFDEQNILNVNVGGMDKDAWTEAEEQTAEKKQRRRRRKSRNNISGHKSVDVRLGETNSRGPGLSDTPNIVLLDSSNNAVIKDTTVPSKVKKASKPFVNKMSVEIEAYQDANSGARSASEDSLSRRHTHVQPAPRERCEYLEGADNGPLHLSSDVRDPSSSNDEFPSKKGIEDIAYDEIGDKGKSVVDEPAIDNAKANSITVANEASSHIPQFVSMALSAPGTEISEVLVEDGGEDSSSADSSSDSEDSADDSDVESTKPPVPTFFGPNVLPFSDLDELSLNAVLKPKNPLDWRALLSFEDTSDNEKASSIEEEEEEEHHEKKNTFSSRKMSTSPSVDDAEDDSLSQDATSDPIEDGDSETSNTMNSPRPGRELSRQAIARINTDSGYGSNDAGHNERVASHRAKISPAELLSFRSVNDRGSSVVIDGLGDEALNRAMTEDLTSFLTSVGKFSQGSVSTPLDRREGIQDEDQKLEHNTFDKFGPISQVRDFPEIIDLTESPEDDIGDATYSKLVNPHHKNITDESVASIDQSLDKHSGDLHSSIRRTKLPDSSLNPHSSPILVDSPTKARRMKDRHGNVTASQTTSIDLSQTKPSALAETEDLEIRDDGKHSSPITLLRDSAQLWDGTDHNVTNDQSIIEITSESTKAQSQSSVDVTDEDSLGIGTRLRRRKQVEAVAPSQLKTNVHRVSRVPARNTLSSAKQGVLFSEDKYTVEAIEVLPDPAESRVTKVHTEVREQKRHLTSEIEASPKVNHSIHANSSMDKRGISPAASSQTESEYEVKEPVVEHAPSLRAYRRLTDIASRDDLFSRPSNIRTSFALTPVSSFGNSTIRQSVPDTQVKDDDSDNESSSESDSDDEGTTIPKERRAGRRLAKTRRSLASIFSHVT